jgi:hypothetical protein
MRASDFDAAARFVAAQTDGPDRLLAAHRPDGDGSCRGCSASMTPWPCAAAAIARRAREMPGRK